MTSGTTNPGSMDVRVLWSDGGIDLLATDWNPRRHVRRREEVDHSDAIEFMRGGSFRKRVNGTWMLADCTNATLFRRGQPFEIDHPHEQPNCGTTLRFEPGALDQLLRDGLGLDSAKCRALLSLPQVATSNRCHVLQRTILSMATNGVLDSCTFMDLVRDLARELAAPVAPDCPGLSPADNDARRLRSLRELILQFLPGPVRLEALAARAGFSAPYLSRWFHAHAGVPLHRYIMRVRLRHALERLAEGERDLSRLAIGSGFSNHSHLTRTFQAEFAASPSALRRTLHGPVARGVRRG